MALSPRSDALLKRRSVDKLAKTTDPVEKLRLMCLSRGANGIRGLGRSFRIFDDDGNRQLTFAEFENGVKDYGVIITRDELKTMFAQFDVDRSGSVNFDEFLERLRPPMSARRQGLIARAFSQLDVTGDGKITIEDLKGIFNVRKHPKYINGEWTADRCKLEFLKTFDVRGNHDGTIHKDEFLSYYAAVSASIDDDPYFDLMMRNSYGLSD